MPLFRLRSITPEKLNSATKYPSIPTYHTLGGDGVLSEPAVEFTGTVVATEKIDGCNARIIIVPNSSYALGSREDLVYAQYDYLANAAHGIVETLRPWVDGWNQAGLHEDAIHVLYVEVYGGRKLTPASRDYTSQNAYGFRLFDAAVIRNYAEIAESWDTERIAGWRDRGGQTFLPEDELTALADAAGLQLTPRLLTLDAAELPTEIDKAHDWLTEHASTTRVALDEDARGRAEGIVLRSTDRATIAKMRFQNYTRTRQVQERAART